MYQAYRLLHGQTLYVDRVDGFVPYPYPPGHPALLALIGSVFGVDYGPARSLSAFAFVVLMFVLGTQLRAHVGGRTRGLVLGAVGAAFAACTYPLLEGYYDLARVDTLAATLAVVGAAFVAGPNPPRARLVGASLFFTTAVYTKQTMVFLVGAVVIAVLARDRRRGLQLGGLVFAESALLLAVLSWSTHGMFLRWILDLRHHPLEWRRGLDGAIWFGLRIPWLIAIVPLAIVARVRRVLSYRTVTWLALLCGALPAAALPFAKEGGWINNFIPLFAPAGTVALMLVVDLTRPRRALALSSLYGACAIALAFLWTDQQRLRPSLEDVARAQALSSSIRELQGSVLCPISPMMALRNGHADDQAPWLAYFDATRAGIGAPHEYGQWIERTRPDWILLIDGDTVLDQVEDTANYEFDRELDTPEVGRIPLLYVVPHRLYRRIRLPR